MILPLEIFLLARLHSIGFCGRPVSLDRARLQRSAQIACYKDTVCISHKQTLITSKHIE